MSKIVKATNWRELSHVVECDNKYYLVDSAVTADHGEETMVFAWNRQKDDVENWSGLYCERYSDYVEMKTKHYWICKNLELVLKNANGYVSDITFADFIITMLDKVKK